MVGKELSKEEKYKVGQVITETKPGIINSENAEVTFLEVLAEIRNDIKEIRKKLID